MSVVPFVPPGPAGPPPEPPPPDPRRRLLAAAGLAALCLPFVPAYLLSALVGAVRAGVVAGWRDVRRLTDADPEGPP